MTDMDFPPVQRREVSPEGCSGTAPARIFPAKALLTRPDMVELLAQCLYRSAQAADQAAAYQARRGIVAYATARDGAAQGLLVADTAVRPWEIAALAVAGGARRRGVGRALLAYAARQAGQTGLAAETDDDAVHFYENCGFSVAALGKKYPGTPRYRCVLGPAAPESGPAEYWDIYDARHRPLHRTHRRGMPLGAGLHHDIAEIWTVNTRRQLLLTLRHPDKEMLPNLWEITCGSVLAGESCIDGALRELREETGIAAAAQGLHFLGGKLDGSAFVNSYLVKADLPLSDLMLQPGETVDAQWVTLPQLRRLMHAGLVARPVELRFEELADQLLPYLAGAGEEDIF